MKRPTAALAAVFLAAVAHAAPYRAQFGRDNTLPHSESVTGSPVRGWQPSVAARFGGSGFGTDAGFVTADDGTLYWAAVDTMYALDPETFDVRWSASIPTTLQSSTPAVIADDGVAVGAFSGTSVSVFDSAGASLHTTDISVATSSFLTVSSDGSTLYAAASSSLVAFDAAAGTELWRRDDLPGFAISGPVLDVTFGPIVFALLDDGSLAGYYTADGTPFLTFTGDGVRPSGVASWFGQFFIGDESGRLSKVNFGTRVWELDLGDAALIGPPSFYEASAKIVVATAAEVIVVTDNSASGSVDWRLPGGSTGLAMTIDSDGIIYVMQFNSLVGYDLIEGVQLWSVDIGTAIAPFGFDGSGRLFASVIAPNLELLRLEFVPVISSISPTAAQSGTTVVTVSGSNLGPQSSTSVSISLIDASASDPVPISCPTSAVDPAAADSALCSPEESTAPGDYFVRVVVAGDNEVTSTATLTILGGDSQSAVPAPDTQSQTPAPVPDTQSQTPVPVPDTQSQSRVPAADTQSAAPVEQTQSPAPVDVSLSELAAYQGDAAMTGTVTWAHGYQRLWAGSEAATVSELTETALVGGLTVDASGTVYAGLNLGWVAAISPAGALLWESKFGGATNLAYPTVARDPSQAEVLLIAPAGQTIYSANPEEGNILFVLDVFVAGADTIRHSPVLTSDHRSAFYSTGTLVVRVDVTGTDGTLETGYTLSVGSETTTSPALDEANNRIFVGAGQSMYAFDLSTSAELWSYRASEQIDSSPTLSIAASLVFFVDGSGLMYGLGMSSGDSEWGIPVDLGISPVGEVETTAALTADGSLLIQPVDNDDHSAVHGIRAATGDIAWSTTLSDIVDYAPPIIDGNGIAYLATDGGLVALDSLTGDMVWSWSGLSSVKMSAAVGPDGAVTVATGFNGVVRFEFSPEIASFSPPTVAPNTVLTIRGRNLGPSDATDVLISIGGTSCRVIPSSDVDSVSCTVSPSQVLGTFSVSLQIEGFSIEAPSTLTVASEAASDPDWPMFGFDPAHTGVTPFTPSSSVFDPIELYAVVVPFTTSSPVVSNGVLYQLTQGNQVVAIDTAEGAVMWTYESGESLLGGTTPGIAADGTVIVLAFSQVIGIDGVSGSQRWITSVFGTGSRTLVGSPTMSADLTEVYVATGAMLAALDASSGAVLWDASAQSGSSDFFVSGPSLNTATGTLHVGALDGGLYSVDIETRAVTTTQTLVGEVTTLPAVDESSGDIYLAYGSAAEGFFAGAVSASGTLRWSIALDSQCDASPALSVARGQVYFTTTGGTLLCLSTVDGSETCSADYSEFKTSAPMIDGLGRVCAMSARGLVFCRDADNASNEAWRVSIGSTFSPTSLAMDTDGNFYAAAAERVRRLSFLPRIDSVAPATALPGGVITLTGVNLDSDASTITVTLVDNDGASTGGACTIEASTLDSTRLECRLDSAVVGSSLLPEVTVDGVSAIVMASPIVVLDQVPFPVMTSGYPQVRDITQTSFVFVIQVETAAHALVLVQPSSSAAPSVEFVESDGITVLDVGPGFEREIPVNGLSPSTEYTVYYVLMSLTFPDEFPDTATVGPDVQTLAAHTESPSLVPVMLSDFTISLLSSTEIELSFTSSDVSAIDWLVGEGASAASASPSVDDVLAGDLGGLEYASGTFTASQGVTSFSIGVNAMTEGETYVVFIAARQGDGTTVYSAMSVFSSSAQVEFVSLPSAGESSVFMQLQLNGEGSIFVAVELGSEFQSYSALDIEEKSQAEGAVLFAESSDSLVDVTFDGLYSGQDYWVYVSGRLASGRLTDSALAEFVSTPRGPISVRLTASTEISDEAVDEVIDWVAETIGVESAAIYSEVSVSGRRTAEMARNGRRTEIELGYSIPQGIVDTAAYRDGLNANLKDNGSNPPVSITDATFFSLEEGTSDSVTDPFGRSGNNGGGGGGGSGSGMTIVVVAVIALILIVVVVCICRRRRAKTAAATSASNNDGAAQEA